MAYKIDEIEGIGPAYAEKMVAAGIANTDDLLKKCATPAGRAAVAAATGMGESTILKWTNMADLMRISGIGPQFAELLKGTGVDTVKELRNRNAENLAESMKTVNDEKKLARVSPPGATVSKWVAAAKDMDPIITY
jgi:predicted flap endonuclease-1-like 5' DNA nuclease